MADTAVVEAPKTETKSPAFPGMNIAADEAAEVSKLWQVNPLPPEEKKPETAKTAETTATAKAETKAVEPSEKEDEDFLGKTEVPKTKIKEHFDARRAAEGRRKGRLEARIADLTKQLDSAKTTPTLANIEEDARYKSLQDERQELFNQLRMANVERLPQFRDYFNNLYGEQITMAKEIVGKEKEELVSQLLKSDKSAGRTQQFRELCAELDPFDANRLANVVSAYDAITAKRAQAIKVEADNYEKFQASEKLKTENTTKERKAAAEKLFSDMVTSVADKEKGMYVFQKQDGKDDWNKGVDDRVAYAKSLLFGEHKPEVMLQAAFNAAALPALIQASIADKNRIKELEEQVKGMTAAQPVLETGGGVGGGGESATATETGKRKGPPQMTRNTMADAADWMKQTFADTTENQ